MKGKNLGQVYDRLTPEERFRLVLEARSRQDDRESDRLANTCPRITYTRTQNDLAYANRIKASWQITTSICLVLTQLWGRLMMVRTSEEWSSLFIRLAATECVQSYHKGWEDGCDHAWRAAGRRGSFPWKGQSVLNDLAEKKAQDAIAVSRKTDDSDRGSTLEDTRGTLIVEASAVVEAFCRFCHATMGVEPEVAVRAWCPPALDCLKEIWEATSSIQIDETLLEEYEATLTGAWHELVKKG